MKPGIYHGIVSRLAMVEGRHGIKVIMMLKGEEILQGEISTSEKKEAEKLLLTNPGDEVSFTFSCDFVNWFTDFTNHTLEAELKGEDHAPPIGTH